jgi:hypothetical protein
VVTRARVGRLISSQPFSLANGHHRIDVIADPNIDQFDIRMAGRIVFSDLVAAPNPGRADTSAAVRTVPFTPTLCRFVIARR